MICENFMSFLNFWEIFGQVWMFEIYTMICGMGYLVLVGSLSLIVAGGLLRGIPPLKRMGGVTVWV